MNSFNPPSIRCSILLLIGTLVVSGCSGSSNSASTGSQSSAETSGPDGDGDNTIGENVMEDVGATIGELESEEPSTTRVNFDITVPAYMSNALQVRLVCGDIDTTAIWKSDELWMASVDLPVNTENQLVVTFSDDNGAITLGSVERIFTTGTNQSETLQISASEFDTERWDSDGDGVSNLSESIAGTITSAGDLTDLPVGTLQAVQINLQLVADKTFRISWQISDDAQFYRVLENPDGISGFTQISEDLESSIQQYDHRVALYKRVNASYIVQACNATGCIDSNTLSITSSLEGAIGYIKASNPESGDAFGDAISLSSDGNTLAVGSLYEDGGATGANGDQNDNTVEDSGAVYVFVRNNGAWQQQAYLKASNTAARDSFGWALTLSSDGNTLAVGVPKENSNAIGVNGVHTGTSPIRPQIPTERALGFGSGAAYVFSRTNGSWQQQAYLKASNTGSHDAFGHDLSLSADGNTLAVGAPYEDSASSGVNGDQFNDIDGAQNSGAIYVFERSNSTWQQQAYVKQTLAEPSFRTVSHQMGHSVALSADGSTLVAAGSYQIFVFERGNDDWPQQADLQIGFIVDNTIDISANGDTVALGTLSDRSDATGVNSTGTSKEEPRSGAVFVYQRNEGTWTEQARIKSSNTEALDEFGVSVSLSADGNTLAVGAAGEDSLGSGFSNEQSDNSRLEAGAVYLFSRSDNTWVQKSFIKAINSWGGKRFSQVSLSADGNTLAVGAGGDSSGATGINGEHFNDLSEGSGAVHLY